MKTYSVYTYDVWGNAEDGYTVNNRFYNKKIETSDNPIKAIRFIENYDRGKTVKPIRFVIPYVIVNSK